MLYPTTFRKFSFAVTMVPSGMNSITAWLRSSAVSRLLAFTASNSRSVTSLANFTTFSTSPAALHSGT